MQRAWRLRRRSRRTQQRAAYTVTATAGALAANFALTNTHGQAHFDHDATGGTPQSATISTAFASTLKATVRDAGNNPVTGVVVTFAAPAPERSGTFAGGVNTATTNASGVATSAVTFTANASAGGYNVTATAGALTANFALTNIWSGAASIDDGDGRDSAERGRSIRTFASTLRATVKDAGNNPVTGVMVTFAAPGTEPAERLRAELNTATTNAAGVATSAVFTANATAGSYNVTATAGALTANFALTNLTRIRRRR